MRLIFITPNAARELQATVDRTQKLLYGMRRDKERRLLGAAGGVGAVFVVIILRLLA